MFTGHIEIEKPVFSAKSDFNNTQNLNYYL
jgi:hypothetical protein